ncbi:MAG: response regulator [Phycisphaerae bacterium]|jgi:DNA-binding response OmpR family regulator|nr:response regulator [Phycisphaerae bacterium]
MSDSFSVLRDRRILVVDDSVQITSLLDEVFTHCGSTVVTANSGQDAMVMLASESFDLVILDLIMPRPDGRDVLVFMRQARPEILPRTLLLTGDRYHNNSALSGIDESEIQILYKPFDLSLLRAAAACRLVKCAEVLGAA